LEVAKIKKKNYVMTKKHKGNGLETKGSHSMKTGGQALCWVNDSNAEKKGETGKGKMRSNGPVSGPSIRSNGGLGGSAKTV